MQEYIGTPGRLLQLRILRPAAEQSSRGGDSAAAVQNLGTALAKGDPPWR
ncbi:MAG: hypothetical protein LBU32_24280 [Clostridiales bacterium]|nr:hypothetical protein [Clostridiales bacterium]